MKSIQDLVEERNLAKETKQMMPQRPDQSWLGSISGMFSDFFNAIIDRVWSVNIKEMPEIKWPDIKIPEIVVPKAEVTVTIPDVKVNIPEVKIPDVKVDFKDFKIPPQEVIVKIPNIVMPKFPPYPKMPDIPAIKIPEIKVPATKVVVEYKFPDSPLEVSYDYDKAGDLIEVVEKYKNGIKTATKKYNKWVIKDNRD
jgi:hypothetical protein